MPIHIQLDVPSLSTKGWFWKQPPAYEVPSLPKIMSEEDLAKEDEARTFASQGMDPSFDLAIASNDTEGAWSMVNTMMDHYLQFREQQAELPRKESPRSRLFISAGPLFLKPARTVPFLLRKRQHQPSFAV